MTTATTMKILNDDVLDEPSIARGSSCDAGFGRFIVTSSWICGGSRRYL